MPKYNEKIRVLCVDDDTYQLEAMKLFFEPEDDMLVRFSSSPNEAAEEIRHNEFDCVVTDCLMK
jgi:CheY-like chemotaxis protein